MVDDKTEEMLRSHALVRRNIEKHGQHIWSVSVAEHDLLGSFPFAYTVGNYERGFPELLITGPVADSYGVVLNVLRNFKAIAAEASTTVRKSVSAVSTRFASSRQGMLDASNVRPSSAGFTIPTSTRYDRFSCVILTADGRGTQSALRDIAISLS